MPGQGKARGGSLGQLTAPSSISGPSASGFIRVCVCLCARVRVVPPFSLPVTVVIVVWVNHNFVSVQRLSRKANFHVKVINFIFRSVVFIILFKAKCHLVTNFVIFVIPKANRTSINTDVARYESVLPRSLAFLEAKRGQGKWFVISGLIDWVW